LFGLLVETRNQLVRSVERDLAAAGLSWAKLRLLMHLAKQELASGRGVLPSELSQMQDISRNTVSALISSLETDGLVARHLHAQDRRKWIICLTPRGHEVLDAQLGAHFEFIHRCFGVFSLRERDMLSTLLRRLGACLKKEQDSNTCE
jgi:DNA-binding MarR family transcriptional regulator